MAVKMVKRTSKWNGEETREEFAVAVDRLVSASGAKRDEIEAELRSGRRMQTAFAFYELETDEQ